MKKLKTILLLPLLAISAFATAATDKPNILVIWGDDIGPFNISAYNRGVMGYKTPNIDRIANEGILFTDAYGDQSCTAGRAGFLTGQHPIRTGLTKVGLPSAPEGLHKDDVTIAELLKPMGYATGQFGKNHLGDRDEHLPTNHGFDEFLVTCITSMLRKNLSMRITRRILSSSSAMVHAASSTALLMAISRIRAH